VADHVGGVSRPSVRLTLFSIGGAVVVAALVVSLSGTEHAPRGPIAVPNAEHVAALDSLIGGIRHVFNTTAPEHLQADTTYPTSASTLLWFQGVGASVVPNGGAVVLDGAGGAIRFDERLRAHRVGLRLAGREPISIAAGVEGRYWVADAAGDLHSIDGLGKIITSTPTGFAYASAYSDGTGGAFVSRSSRMFAFRIATERDPLLVHVDGAGDLIDTVGSVKLPDHVLLAELANAGHIATKNGVVFFAPFIRDEVVAFSDRGDTLWIAHRGLPQSTPNPRIEIGEDGPVLDYAPVNLGLTVGPDGLLYVLSIPGFTTSETRLDVMDPADGTLLRTTTIDDPLPTIAAGTDGRVYDLDPFRLLTGVAPREREAFADFDLERLDGTRMALGDLRGKVVLINFWASWCLPCRTEMPALDSLRRSIDDPDFAFVTMNEDIDVGDARAFIDEFGFAFPVLLGHGKLERTYHYYGLPYTVAIDRQGRMLERWIGYAGEEQIAGIRAVIRAELLRGDVDEDDDGPPMAHERH
jgi:thiol-disulfide isomerase/thioredoxin